MPRALAAAIAATLATLPMTSRAEPPAGGRIVSDEGQIEILSRPLRAGDRIELPEGYLVVEEDGPESAGVGSFGVVAAGALAAAGATLPEVSPGDGAGPAAGTAAPRSCAAERSAFLAELWRESGIDVKDPAALLDGLEAGATGPATGYYWFALQSDPFRSLAWSSALRARGEALARCAREAASAAGPGDAAAAALAGR